MSTESTNNFHGYAQATNILQAYVLDCKSGSAEKTESTSKEVKLVKYLSRVKARSNTFTIALRIAGGDEMGSLESETVKYGREFHGTRTRE
jgi:hypothetical protein